MTLRSLCANNRSRVCACGSLAMWRPHLLALALVLGAHVCAGSDQQVVQVMVSNSFNEEGCVMPEATSFVQYGVTSYVMTRFWGSAFVAAIYLPDKEAIALKCVSSWGCLSHQTTHIPYPLRRCHLLFEREALQRHCYREVICPAAEDAAPVPPNFEMVAKHNLNSRRARTAM